MYTVLFLSKDKFLVIKVEILKGFIFFRDIGAGMSAMYDE